MPSVAANAVLNDTRTHILQNPQIRSTDGQTAKLKIGERVPYATGSFLPSLGASTSTSGVGLLASTQFQFQDVGVNLELTPHLLADGEVAIHASIEISSLGANVTVGGVSEPTFGERKIEHDIRLKEGETSVLGGLIQTTLTNTVSGVPFLGDVPLLRYLFSTEHAERTGNGGPGHVDSPRRAQKRNVAEERHASHSISYGSLNQASEHAHFTFLQANVMLNLPLAESGLAHPRDSKRSRPGKKSRSRRGSPPRH